MASAKIAIGVPLGPDVPEAIDLWGKEILPKLGISTRQISADAIKPRRRVVKQRRAFTDGIVPGDPFESVPKIDVEVG